MPLKRQFVEKGIQLMQINEFLTKVLENSRYAGLELQKSPLGYRITIKTASPGLVIGRKGIRIRELSEALSKKFGIENPEIEVEAVENPDLNAQIMAESLAYGIKKGQNYRRTAYSIIRRIMKAGARGVEVKISGKSTSQRARSQIFRNGIISKCGGPALNGVRKGVSRVVMKSGTIGIIVKIMPLDYRLPDEILLRDPNLKRKIGEKRVVLTPEYDGGDVLISKSDSTIIIDAEKGEESIFDELEEDLEIESVTTEELEKEDEDLISDDIQEEELDQEEEETPKTTKKKRATKKDDKKSKKKTSKKSKKNKKKITEDEEN